MSEARGRGAAIVAAHPHSDQHDDPERTTRRFWREWQLLGGLIDRYELFNRREVFGWVASAGLPAVASGDFHRREHLSSWKTLLPCEKTRGRRRRLSSLGPTSLRDSPRARAFAGRSGSRVARVARPGPDSAYHLGMAKVKVEPALRAGLLNRELSWLDFNARVLDLMADPGRAASRAGQVLLDLLFEPGRVLHGPRRRSDAAVGGRSRAALARRDDAQADADCDPRAGARTHGATVRDLGAGSQAVARRSGHRDRRDRGLHRGRVDEI